MFDGCCGRRTVQAGVVTFGVMLAIAAPAHAADSLPVPTFSKDVAPILQAKCQECHQPNSIAPMSLITYPGGAALGALDQGARRTRRCRRGTSTAASACRSSRTTCRSATSRSTPSCAGSTAARRRATRRTCRRPSRSSPTTNGKAVRDGFGPPDLVVKSSEYTMPAQHQDVWCRPMSDIPLTEPRWVKMVEIRPTNLKGRKIVHHSIAYLVLNNDPEAVNTGTASGRARDGQPRRPRQPPPAADGMGDRQGLRPVPRRHRQAAPAGREDFVGPAPPRGRRRDHRAGRKSASGSIRKARSRRSAAIWSASPGLRKRKLARHPAELDRPHRRLHGAEGEHAHHQLPAALPPARQGDAGRSDSAGRQRRRSSATSATSTSTG